MDDVTTWKHVAQGCPPDCGHDCAECDDYTPEAIDREALKWAREKETKEGN